ncbi:MAG: 1,2-phenylacetyl-CoA epoxidase subunit PaaC [Anaerolineales bacterium]
MIGAHAAALADQLIAMADDELVLGHRDSEWTGHAPILEEDIAFANLAQDELGHAVAWYGLVHDLRGDVADHLVFFREPEQYRNVQLVELPNGDWAFSMLRQFLFDAAERARLPLLAQSAFGPLAATAAKIRTEELYHDRHTRAWVKRLAQGTEESHNRMQRALNAAWPLAFQLFNPLPGEAALTRAGLIPAAAAVQMAWLDDVGPFLQNIGLEIPVGDPPTLERSRHSEYLAALLNEMQSVARTEEPDVPW